MGMTSLGLGRMRHRRIARHAFPYAVALCAALLLGGCVPQTGATRVSVLGGAVTLGLPAGYCIDRSASREMHDSAVLLIGRCSTASAPAPALVSVAIGAEDSAGVLAGGGKALAGFLTSDRGRSMLSVSGRARDLRVAQFIEGEGVYLLHLEDRRIGAYWRAVLGVRGRLVSVSVRAAPGQKLDSAVARDLANRTAQAIRRANGQTGRQD